MSDTVVGVFRDMEHAEQVMNDLRTVGFPTSSMALRPSGELHQEPQRQEHGADDEATFTREGAIIGTVAIGTVGAVISFANVHVSPQVAVLNALPRSVFTTLLLGVAGWLAGGIVGLGVPKGREVGMAPGGPVALSVRAPGRIEEVRSIFSYNGVLDLQGADATELAARA